MSASPLAELGSPRVLRWLGEVTGGATPTGCTADRCVPRRSYFDLRAFVERDGVRAPVELQVHPAAAGRQGLDCGAWTLVHRDPRADPLLPIDRALSADCRDELGLRLGARVTGAELRSYVPERRAVVRYRGEDGASWFGKLHRTPAAAVLEAAEQLAARGLADMLAAPACLLPDLELVVWREVPGPLLSAAFPGRVYDAGLRAAGRALRRVHETPLAAPAKGRTLREELGVAAEFFDRASALRGDGAPLAGVRAAIDDLPARVTACEPAAPALLHKDFHDNQVVLGDRGTVLLDLDQIGPGDPAIDVGNFLAHIDFRIAYTVSTTPRAPLLARFLDGYGAVHDPGFARRVEVSHAVSLLRNVALYLHLPARRDRLAGALAEALGG